MIQLVFTSLLAGISQGLTGFGAGIILMIYLPYLFNLPQSAGIVGAISISLCILMTYKYRTYLHLKKVILPYLLFLIICSTSILLSTLVNDSLLKKCLGLFLIILSIYYLFFNKIRKTSQTFDIFCIITSAICDGLFGIGGPLMVIYFKNKTNTIQEYLGNMHLFLLINCIYNTCLRSYKGILLPKHLPYIFIGMLGIMTGSLIAKKLINCIDEKTVNQMTYILIGISGILNLL